MKRNYRIKDSPGGRINKFSKLVRYLPFKNYSTYQYLVVLRRA